MAQNISRWSTNINCEQWKTFGSCIGTGKRSELLWDWSVPTGDTSDPLRKVFQNHKLKLFSSQQIQFTFPHCLMSLPGPQVWPAAREVNHLRGDSNGVLQAFLWLYMGHCHLQCNGTHWQPPTLNPHPCKCRWKVKLHISCNILVILPVNQSMKVTQSKSFGQVLIREVHCTFAGQCCETSTNGIYNQTLHSSLCFQFYSNFIIKQWNPRRAHGPLEPLPSNSEDRQMFLCVCLFVLKQWVDLVQTSPFLGRPRPSSLLH